MNEFVAVIPKYETTLSFCVGVWLSFVFSGKVNINGRDCRVYSGLRPELQNVLIKSHEEFQIHIDTASAGLTKQKGKGNGNTGSGSAVGMDALKLAQLLCATFIDKPVLSVDTGADDEDQASSRIAAMMHRDDVTQPLASFIEQTMHMPLTLHEAPRGALMALSTSSSKNSMELMDTMAIILTHVDKAVPYSWMVLASDTAEVYAERQHFVEKTQKIFRTVENLEKFLSMRTVYTLNILLDAQTSLPDFVLKVDQATQDFLATMAREVAAQTGRKAPVETERPFLDSLIAFDSILPPSTWVTSWSEMLEKCKDAAELRKHVLERTGLSESPNTQLSQLSLGANLKLKGERTPAYEEELKDVAASDEDGGLGNEVEVGGTPEEGTGTGGSDVKPDKKRVKLDPESLCLTAVNSFQDVPRGSKALSSSSEAETLGLTADYFTATGMKALEKKLEVLMWQVFEYESGDLSPLVLNVKATKKQEQLKVKFPFNEQRFCLPFVGQVQQGKAGIEKDRQTHVYKTCSVFGVEFYVTGSGSDLLAHDVVVPAWCTRPVNKADAAYFQKIMKKYYILLLKPAFCESPTLMDIEAVLPGPEAFANMDATVLWAEKKGLKVGQTACVVECSLQCVVPICNLEAKLNADVQRAKDKADKVAQNMIHRSVKESARAAKARAKAEAKAAAKKGKKRRADGHGDGDEAAVDAADDAEECEARAKAIETAAEEKQANLDKLVEQHLADIKVPDFLPLTVLASNAEKAANSARAALMQQAMKDANSLRAGAASETKAEEDSDQLIGMKAAVAAFLRDGALKIKKGKDKDDRLDRVNA